MYGLVIKAVVQLVSSIKTMRLEGFFYLHLTIVFLAFLHLTELQMNICEKKHLSSPDVSQKNRLYSSCSAHFTDNRSPASFILYYLY